MLFVTFHGGKPETHAPLNNVHAYDGEGRELSEGVLMAPAGGALNELRSICLRGDLLYVSNANRLESSVLCYRGRGIRYEFESVFVSHAGAAGVNHPFEAAFDDAGFCYVSSQDSNVVTRLVVSVDGRTGTPAALPPALRHAGKFLPGTFVASAKDGLAGAETTAMPPPMGLEYTAAEGDKTHSVRGVLWAEGALYVVDQPAGRVKIYDREGRFGGQSNRVESPVHLTLYQGNLYVSGGDQVLIGKLPRPMGDFELLPLHGVKIKNGCGMAFTASGHLYVASRTENEIWKFDEKLKPMRFVCKLPDNPEFLLHMPSAHG